MFSNLISVNCWFILIISASKTCSDDGRIAPNLTPDFTSLTLEVNNSFFEDSNAFFSWSNKTEKKYWLIRVFIWYKLTSIICYCVLVCASFNLVFASIIPPLYTNWFTSKVALYWSLFKDWTPGSEVGDPITSDW